MDERRDRGRRPLKRLKEKPAILVYVEGGGDSEATRTANRLAFSSLFDGLRELAMPISLRVVCVGGRTATYEAFRDAGTLRPAALKILLVDAEQEYDGRGVWRHLKEVRTEDGWERPAWATENHAYLMVPTVEAWIVKDGECLKRHCPHGFDPTKLPKRRNLEKHPKLDIYAALQTATKECGGYAKRDAFKLVGLISPERLTVRDARYDALAAAGRLFAGLPELIEEYKRAG